MSSGIFALDICLCLVISAYLLFSYGDWMRQRVAVTLAVLIAWYFSFLIIFILPLDVSQTVYKQCVNQNHNLTPSSVVTVTAEDIHKVKSNATETGSTPSPPSGVCNPPYSLLGDNVLPNLWRVVYWSSQLLTWFILPLMQSFSQAGEFTFKGKLKSALWDNAIYYSSYLFIALILVIYIAVQTTFKLDWKTTKTIAAAASNTWGLFVLVLMLGYGLIEVPRNCWKCTQRGYQLNRAYFKVAKLMSERSDAKEELDDSLVALNAVSQVIGMADARRPLVEVILSKVPLEMMEKVKRRRLEEETPYDINTTTEKTLVRLHRQIIRALNTHHRTEATWADTTKKVFQLEDTNRNMISNEHVYKHSLSPSPPPWLSKTFFTPSVEWYWRCLLKPLIMRGLAVLAAIMSALIIWSEVTFFSVHPPLSLFAVFINLAKNSYNYLAIESVCFLTICYLSICAFYTIFKIRVLNYYYLAGNHQSDEYTLLFSGALLCRLTPPLCLNFISLIHLDSHVIEKVDMETAYTRVMGHMDVVAIVSDYFNIYFPIALLGLSMATYFSVGSRLLSAIGFQQFLDQDSEVTLEMVDEGKEHIKREKRRIQRLHESRNRRTADAAPPSASSSYATSEYRQSDIVKNRAGNFGVSSPERSLLSPSSRRPAADVENQESRTMSSPPRNIFDDL